MKHVKSYSKRFILGLLVLLMFANTTFAFSIDFHFCKGEMQSIAFFGEKAVCENMEKVVELPPCCQKKKVPTDKPSFTKKSCCSNENYVLDTQATHDNSENTTFQAPAIQPAILTESFQFEEFVFCVEREIPPPESVRIYALNKQAELQVFRI